MWYCTGLRASISRDCETGLCLVFFWPLPPAPCAPLCPLTTRDLSTHFPTWNAPILGQMKQCCAYALQTENVTCNYYYYQLISSHLLRVKVSMPSKLRFSLNKDMTLLWELTGYGTLFFSTSLHQPSSALLSWLKPRGTTQENHSNLCVLMTG